MIVNVTVHVAGARVLGAGVFAAIVDARLVSRTVRVASASEQHAGDPRIAAETRRALADGLVIYTVANRVLAACRQRWRAHRNAIVLDAHVRTAAIAVRSASRN